MTVTVRQLMMHGQKKLITATVHCLQTSSSCGYQCQLIQFQRGHQSHVQVVMLSRKIWQILLIRLLKRETEREGAICVTTDRVQNWPLCARKNGWVQTQKVEKNAIY